MKNRAAAAGLLAAMAALILDSRCASQSARSALELCLRTLIPSLFPLFVLSSMLIPKLSGLRLPLLSRLLGIPEGSEGIFLLGCAGGFPVGAACIVQSVQTGGLSGSDAKRMLGFCSFCGPSFLFGVIGAVLSLPDALLIFAIQLETALLTAAYWPNHSSDTCTPSSETIDLPTAVRRAISSMAIICAWVILAGVTAGFLDRWLFPILPSTLGILLTGLLELTNGIFSLEAVTSAELRFLLSAGFVCFGGVSVLLQIGGLAATTGLSMKHCIAQKAVQSILGGLLAYLCIRLGPAILLLPPALLFAKIAVEIPAGMVYNSRRKEGI